MNPLSFKQYLKSLEEDTDTDIANLTIQKQQLVVRKATATKPLDDQINNTDKVLMQKEKLKQEEDKKKAASTTQPGTTQAGGNKTTTPGSGGAQTPGQASQSGAGK